MPMPRLLKRLSEKNLRKRTQSLDVKAIDTEPVPPVPPPKSPYRYNSLEELPKGSGTPANPHPRSKAVEHPTIEPRSDAKTVAFPAHVGKHEHNGPDELAELWTDLAKKAPAEASKADKTLEKIEGTVAAVQANVQGASTVVNGIKTVLNAAGGMQAIEQGINSFLEGSTTLMNALDSVEKLHPFIGVAVMAFKTVYTLEVNRRGNDKKIIALHVEMSDMMGVLVQLKDVKDANDVAPDGTTIKGRLESLVHQAAKDIKACSNACDTYSKKKLVVKVLKSTSWKEDLVQFSGTFTKRRAEFEFALTIHTARGVDAANKTIGDVDQTTRAMNEKMDMMMKLFEKFVPSEEKEMEKLIARKGGAKACQEDDKILQELSELKSGNSVPVGPPQGGRRAGAKMSSDLDDIKEDLRLDPAAAMEKNMEVFSRKFELQKEQIVHEMELLVVREGDRVISAVTAGPHDKIVDPDVHQLWKDMGWRGSVKARHFVMGLRDHFHDKWNIGNRHKHLANAATADIPPDTPTTGQNADQWALAFISIVRLQPVREAFDDDASGFVTVAEANAFTRSRPLGWSLPHWIAYWAVGSHQTLYDYAEKIKNLFSKMFAILPKIPKENVNSINEYLQSVYPGIVTLQMSVTPCSIGEGLQAKFKSYVEAEESRMKRALEQVEYHIDATDTLALITGPGRIEQFILPLLYLLLKRHFEIFRLCQHVRPHPDELDDAAETIQCVFNAVYDRVTTLQSMFKQQKLNVTQEFQTFTHGLYSYYSESNGQWAPKSLKDIDFHDDPYDDALEEQNIDSSKILRFPEGQEERDMAAYEVPVPPAPTVFPDVSPLSVILGPWHGFEYEEGETIPSDGMISMNFLLDKVTDEGLHFQASGRDNDSDFKVVGKCTPGDTENLINVTLKRTFPVHYYPSTWQGQLDKSTDTITGTCRSEGEYDDQVDIFILKRTAPEYLRFRPSPEDFEQDKIDALWTYACTAIRDQVRRKSMSWIYLKGRRDNRKRFVELYIRDNSYGRGLNEDEEAELDELRASFTAVDCRFYHSLAQYQARRTIIHTSYYCDNCNGTIGGARLICLICQPKQPWNTVDLCEDPECVAAVVGKEVRSDLPGPHQPTHDLLKVRQVVHTRQFGKLYREAKAALQKSRTIFERLPSSRPAPNGVKAAKGTDLAKKRMSTMEKTTPRCIVCKSPVVQPCWYCVNCEENTFVCMSCDSEKRGVTINNHYMEHALVRCQPLVNEEAAMSVEDRLAKVEKLLESMVQKLSVEKVEKVENA